MLVCRSLRKRPHGTAGFCVLESIGEQGVEHLAMAHAQPGTGFVDEKGRIAHAFHAAGHYRGGAAGADQICSQHGGLHT